MELNFFVMADYASISADQKLSINGIFQNMTATQFPATYPLFYLVTQFRAGPAEYGREFKHQIKLIDEDGVVLAEYAVTASVPNPSIGGITAFINHILQITNFSFPKPGRYQFSLLVDNDQKGELEFELSLI